MRSSLVAAVVAPFAALVSAVPAQAPPGYKTYENKMQRVAFVYPTAYEEIPLPPTEQVTVARFLLKSPSEELKRYEGRFYEATKPKIEVFCFTVGGATTPAASAASEDGGKEAKDAKAPATVREAMEKSSQVGSWDEFKKRLERWRLDEDAKKPGTFALAYTGEWPAAMTSTWGGWLIRKQEGNVVFGVYGTCITEYQKVLQGQLAKIAASLKLADETAGDAAEAAIDKLYASGRYRAVEFRKRARADLAKGWKALDTENFLIVHHSKNDALVKHIARDIEAMRAFYMELFAPTGAMDKLAIVRICQTKDEYLQYGGPPGTGGYWHPGNEELVFFDYSYTQKTLDDDERKRMGRAKLTDDDSLLVLYHEAFHQYIHYAVGEFAPHDWFNEGFGDYFSGAQVGDNGRVLRIEPSPWRIHLAKDMCEFGDGFIPLKEILEAERAVFYHPSRVRFFYAGAWSFLYFLKTSKEAAAHPQWSMILTRYFEAMKASYAEQIGKLGGEANLQQKTVAGFGARRAALQAALAGIDLDALERTWRKWVVDLKDPWPSQRPKRKK